MFIVAKVETIMANGRSLEVRLRLSGIAMMHLEEWAS